MSTNGIEPRALLLTREELASLTGCKQTKRMCAWLRAHDWFYIAPSRKGEVPKVDRTYYLARMSGQRPAAAAGARPDRPRVRTEFMLEPQ